MLSLRVHVKSGSCTSGVWSRTPNPVPPVVIIRSTWPLLAQVVTHSCIKGTSSETIRCSEQDSPDVPSSSMILGPDLSLVESDDAVSLTRYN